MFDTVNMRLKSFDVDGVDFLEETPCYIDVAGEHIYDGEYVITGDLNGLKVTVSRQGVSIKDGSLCKWFLGNNYQTMRRGDAKQAIEKLSDTLHLPIDRAIITRLDIASNLITNYPIEVYTNHLGILKNAKRLIEPNGLYYRSNNVRLCIYDKNQEQRAKGGRIPELYKNKNVLRYEMRHTGRLARQLGVSAVTGASLYDEVFYMKLLNCWKDTYFAIGKINDVTFNFDLMRSRKELDNAGRLLAYESRGGELTVLSDIEEAQKRGELTKKQAYDARRLVKETYQIKTNLIVPNNAILELDEKVKKEVRFYR